MSFCCGNMEYYVKENKEITYDIHLRYYGLKLADDDSGTVQQLFYCPWCGTKLPKSLELKWVQVLNEEYNIKDPIFDDADKIPSEFYTDEWWKKRDI
ncbi:hypothetical protein NOVO_01210 [Rickettsiales bacterium Ac37b]|nr:hypothetical protein NOVO_01210 [Rickettsiales bacterium Ac37b]